MRRPNCFGTPERVPACQTCGVREECWEQQAHGVFLLPRDREPARAEKRAGSTYAEESLQPWLREEEPSA
jgi:hypothetical protein